MQRSDEEHEAHLRTVAAVMVVVAVAIGAGALAWAMQGLSDRPVREEVLKTALQFIGVALLGGTAAYFFWHLQQDRLVAAAGREGRAADEAKTRAAEEAARRAADERNRSDKARRDEILRSVVERTLLAYNEAKHLRRMIAAESSRPGGPPRLTLARYDEYLRALSLVQLRLEHVTRMLPLADDQRLVSGDPKALSPCEKSFRSIEDFFNGVVQEYEDHRNDVVDGDHVSLADLPRLQEFLTSTHFRRGTSEHITVIMRTVREAILQAREPDAA